MRKKIDDIVFTGWAAEMEPPPKIKVTWSGCEEAMSEARGDAVNHPPHYTSHPSGIECITITQHMNFCCGNVVKYVWRAGLKDQSDDITDLEKAEFYLRCEIARRKQLQGK